MNLAEAYKTVEGMVEAYRAMVAECNHPLYRRGAAIETRAREGRHIVHVREIFRRIVDGYITNRTIHWANQVEEESGTRPTRDERYDYAIQLIEKIGLKADTSQRQWFDYPAVVWPEV